MISGSSPNGVEMRVSLLTRREDVEEGGLNVKRNTLLTLWVASFAIQQEMPSNSALTKQAASNASSRLLQPSGVNVKMGGTDVRRGFCSQVCNIAIGIQVRCLSMTSRKAKVKASTAHMEVAKARIAMMRYPGERT